jgi:hypothetical protein
MKFSLKPGAEIETTTPQETAQIIARAFDTRTVEEYTRRKGIITLNSSGAGQGKVRLSSEYDWRIERITLGGLGAVSATVQFFENSDNSAADLLEVVGLGTAGLYSDGFDNTLYLPANSQLIIDVAGGVANLQVTYNLQIKQLPRKQ